MWQLFKYNGHYIQGDLISKHSSESAALKKAKKELDFSYSTKVTRSDEVLIWLDDKEHTPVGVVIKKKKKGDAMVSTG